MQTPGEIQIAQWSVVARTVTAETLVLNADRSVASRTRTDLTGGTVYFTVRDEDDAVVISKRSSNTDEIEILDQTSDDTRGQAKIKFTEADTEDLTPGAKYYFDVWASLEDGTQDAVIDRGRFHVRKAVTRISDVAPSVVSWPTTSEDLLSRFGNPAGATVLGILQDSRGSTPAAIGDERTDVVFTGGVEQGFVLPVNNPFEGAPALGQDPFYGRFFGMSPHGSTLYDSSTVDNPFHFPAGQDYLVFLIARVRGYDQALDKRIFRISPGIEMYISEGAWKVTDVTPPEWVTSDLVYADDEIHFLGLGRQNNQSFLITEKEKIVRGENLADVGRTSSWVQLLQAYVDLFYLGIISGFGNVAPADAQSFLDSIGRP